MILDRDTGRSRGFDLVFGHGFEYQEAAAKVGAEFPNTIFVRITSYNVCYTKLLRPLEREPGLEVRRIAGRRQRRLERNLARTQQVEQVLVEGLHRLAARHELQDLTGAARILDVGATLVTSSAMIRPLTLNARQVRAPS